MQPTHILISFELAMAIGRELSQLPAGRVAKIFIDLDAAVSAALAPSRTPNEKHAATADDSAIHDESGFATGKTAQ